MEKNRNGLALLKIFKGCEPTVCQVPVSMTSLANFRPLNKLTTHDYVDAANKFQKCNQAGSKLLNSLVKYLTAERSLYL